MGPRGNKCPFRRLFPYLSARVGEGAEEAIADLLLYKMCFTAAVAALSWVYDLQDTFLSKLATKMLLRSDL